MEENSSITQSAPLFASKKYAIDECGPIVAAYKFKSPENMGHVIRLASNFGAYKVIFIGDEQNVRLSKVKKVAGAAYNQVQWLFCSMDNWLSLVPEDYSIVGIETTEDSENIAKCELPLKMAMVLGNEIHGLPEEILAQCQKCYHVPMIGAIKSMNVSHACSVVLYEWVKQYHKIGG